MFLKTLLNFFLSRENKPIWFILINGKKVGPLSINDLKNHPQVNPLTLVKKKGFKKWVPMGTVEELKKIFESRVRKKNKSVPFMKNGTEIVMEEGRVGFFPSLWWVLLALLLAAYVFIKVRFLL